MFRKTQRADEPRTNDLANVNAKRLSITLILALVLPFLILWAVRTRQFRQIPDADAMDYAQIARNIGTGHGFTTSIIRPLATTNVQSMTAMPDTVHAPLFAYVEAVAMAGGSASDFRAFLVACAFFFLTIPVLYVLTKSMFNERVAQLAVFAYVTSAFMTNMVLSCGPATMSGFVFTLLCLVLLRYAQAAAPETGVPDTKTVMIRGGICGLLFAFCYLTDYMLLFAFLPVAICVYVMGKREGKLGLAAFLLVFAIIGGGWMVRNTHYTGNPFFGLKAMEIGMGTKAHPGMSLYRTTVPQSVLGLLRETISEQPKKLLQGIQVAYSALPVLGQPYLVAFFIVGLFYSFRRTGVNALRGMLLGSMILVAVLGGLFIFQLSTLAAFAPIMLAFAAAFFVRLLTDSKAPAIVSRAVSALAVVMLVIPLFISLVVTPQTRVASHLIETDVARRVMPNVPILTDRAFEMTWYGSRTTVWLPDSDKDVENLDKIGHVKAIYLSPNMSPASRSAEDYGSWRELYRTIYQQAVSGQLATWESGPFHDFLLYRDMSQDDSVAYMRSGALLLLRPDASRPQ